jgi:hypothetical protein
VIPARLRRTPPDLLIGALLALATFAAYSVGAGRAMSLDSAATVGHFVLTPSWLDPLRRQVDLNNQPLFSFLERIVVQVTGSHSEPVLRFLPTLAAAVTIGLLTVVAARRLGVVAGVTAGVVLATNATFVIESRDVRGYSLAALCSVVATVVLARLLADRPAPRRVEVWYVLAIAVGIGMHLYVLLLVPAHVAAAVASSRLSRRWVARWAVAVAAGALPYVALAGTMLHHVGPRRGFNPDLPVVMVRTLAGAAIEKPLPAWAFATALVALLAGLAVARPRRVVLAMAGAELAAFVVIWRVVAAIDTYTRFWMFLLPGCAWVVASLVSRVRWLAVPVVAAALAMTTTLAPLYTADDWGFRVAARWIDAAAASGRVTCSLAPRPGSGLQPILAYTHRFRLVRSLPELDGCDVVVEPRRAEPGLHAAMSDRQRFPYAYLTHNPNPILVVSREPLPAAGG